LKVITIFKIIGGGTKGAFQAGVFHSFVHNLPPHEVEYDVVTGNILTKFQELLLVLSMGYYFLHFPKVRKRRYPRF
jgi:hypothetical protein